MRTAKSTCTIVISLAVFAMPMLGQVDRGVTVSHVGNEISISIARTTPLATVLDEVCREASAQCSGTTQAMAAMVPAQEVRGDWRHVISTLLDGAGFNYIATAPSESSPGMLQIAGAASQGKPEQQEVRSTVAATKPSAAMAPPAESSADAASADAPSLSASASTPQSSGAEEPDQSQPSGGGEQASVGGQPGGLFSASDGNSNSAPGQNPVSMLFPDSSGNPIPIAGQGSGSYLLFPDSKGKPIPASNQALPYQLFPDGNGRLIPVQRGGR